MENVSPEIISVLLAVEHLPENGYVVFIGKGLVSKAAFPTFL